MPGMSSTAFDLTGRHAIEKGLPWSLYFTRYAGPARTPVDLTGCAARLEVFDAFTGALLLTLSSASAEEITLGGIAGSVAVRLPGAASAAWTATHLRYRFFFTDASGVDRLYLRGRLGLLEDA